MASPPANLGLLRTTPARLLVLSAGLLLVLELIKIATPLPEFVELFRKVVSLALITSSVWFVVLLIARNRRKLLWRVRRKLIVSYLLIGFVPVVLVVSFALAGSVVLYNDVAAYLFHEELDDMIEEARQIAETSAIEIGRNETGRNVRGAEAVIENKVANLSARYPALSITVIPAERGRPAAVAGPWRHADPPSDLPSWVLTAKGFSGTLALSHALDGGAVNETIPAMLLIRSVVPIAASDRMVLVDLPVDEAVVGRIDERAGTRAGAVDILPAPEEKTRARPLLAGRLADLARRPLLPSATALFRNTVAIEKFVDWQTGDTGRVSIGLAAPVGPLYARMVRGSQLPARVAVGVDPFLLLLIVLAALLAIVEGAALVGGATLARTITHAVHELFAGTEHVRQGDFRHRIRVESADQLGDLADSFNRMSGSIEHLLHVQREKQRLDDELRIARDIQKSLLPVQPPKIAGLTIADHCEPAREVGGDYYDFFLLGPRQIGVLVADVSGKGTSAALYMAELKGLMLALSHAEQSPRRLLINVNQLLADHLDNRSFITATYAVIDLDRMTLTCARAGHTPLLFVSNGESQLLTPDGMVLGLRLPGATERFEQILEEHTMPLHAGDVIVLYTDGITEAMDRDGELFGEAALARAASGPRHEEAAAVRERVLRDVKRFVGDAEQHDDMTMVIVAVGDSAALEKVA